MFMSYTVVDVTPLLLFSSKSNEARPEDLEVDLTDQNPGISLLFPAPDTDNSVLPGN